MLIRFNKVKISVHAKFWQGKNAISVIKDSTQDIENVFAYENPNSKRLKIGMQDVIRTQETTRTLTLVLLLNGKTYQAYAFLLSSLPWLLSHLARDGFEF